MWQLDFDLRLVSSSGYDTRMWTTIYRN